MGFRKMLAERQEKADTLVCVGLDPLVEKMPPPSAARPLIDWSVERWMTDIAIATAPYVSMFKPQSAHWEAMGSAGVEALKRTIANIHKHCPGVPVFLDCKRGDIDRTQAQYRLAHLENLSADGMNFSPYMGRDCMASLVTEKTRGKGLVGLCYTSNPDARQMQDVIVDVNGIKMPYWCFVAGCTSDWATELGVLEDAGLVMAAAYEKPPKGSKVIYSEHLTRCRSIVGDRMWFLIPGIGTQGGFIEETVKYAYAGPGSIAINSSSGIIFASSGEDYAQAAANKARELRDQINAAR